MHTITEDYHASSCACIYTSALLLSANDPPLLVLAAGARVEDSVV